MDWHIEDGFFAEGIGIICGTDEAGRGPLCGPVVAGACILPRDMDIPRLNDSKKLTPKRREELYQIITANAVSWAVDSASPAEIDEYNILNAAMLAMNRAVDKLSPVPELVLVDGTIARGFTLPTRQYKGGDGLSPSIAAASIIAKVTRDRMMAELGETCPELLLERHKGYPTIAHYALLRDYLLRHGTVPDFYRRSFLRKFYTSLS